MNPTLMLISDSVIGTSGGGAQLSIQILAQGLSDHYKVIIFSPGQSRINENHHIAPKYSTFNLKRIGVKGFLHVSILLLQAIRRYQPDIIHLQMSSTMIMFHILRRFRLIPKGIHIVITDRGVYGKASKLTTKSINYLVRESAAVVTTTENNKRNYSLLYPDYAKFKDKFRIIPNTAGLLFEKTNGNNRLAARKRLGISEDSMVIGFCGRISPEKGWPLAEEITYKSVDIIPNLNVIMILSTNNYEDRIRKANEYIDKIHARIGSRLYSFIDIPNDEVLDMYQAMDVFILTSKRESFGRTAIEAMAQGTVVFGTPVDGLPEVLGDKLYLYEDADQAVNLLHKYNEDSLFADKSRKYFYKRYNEHYGVSRNLDLHNRLYRDILRNNEN